MDRIGMKLAMAVSAAAPTRAALALKLRLLADPVIAPLDSLTGAQLRLPFVFVNGEWIGCCADARELVARYRALRDAEAVDVDPRTVIKADLAIPQVSFWLDADSAPAGAPPHG